MTGVSVLHALSFLLSTKMMDGVQIVTNLLMPLKIDASLYYLFLIVVLLVFSSWHILSSSSVSSLSLLLGSRPL